MNNNFFKRVLIAGVLSAFTLGFSACNSGSKESATHDNHEEIDHAQNTAQTHVMDVADYSSVDESFKTQINELYHQYLAVKDGLFAGSVADVQKAAQEIVSQLGKLDATKLSDEQKSFFNEHAQMLKEHAQAIASASSVEEQRSQLDMLSSGTFALVKAFGANDETVFYQYCPMANNNKGAYWISQQKEIQNPYMGQKMPKCGENKETLASK
jgi:hypothetical protein